MVPGKRKPLNPKNTTNTDDLFQEDFIRHGAVRLLIDPDDGETVTISCKTGNDKVKVSVADTGTGIIEEDKNKIFEPLFTTKHRGIGLGLALSKKYIDVNNAFITFTSKTRGGTTFSLSFPSV